ncbi:MAG: SurA N-terminal domain-containing protein [Rubrivivax sp.]|nr:SurA N-terminal domain-containing protein [Rubrivivax sp.]
MFEFIRSHTRLTLGFLLLLIIPSFVFFGVDGYTRFTDGANATVAKVDRTAITRAEWDATHQRQVERVRRQNPAIDAAALDTPEARRATLDSLVRERTLIAAANQLQLFPTVQRMQRLFDSDPQFAGLRGEDGRISRELLAAQGMSPEMFDQRLRQDFGVQQVMAGIVQSAFMTAGVANAALDPMLQRRELQLQYFDPQVYRTRVNPTDEDLETFYKANEASFRRPEQAEIEYAVLDIEQLSRGVAVPEQELRKYYDENASRYTVAEERRASHILVNAPAEMSAAERKQARERAEALLAEVRRNPNAFAEIARRSSQDPGSAAQGGDLDFFGRGMMVKPFEDAVYAMKPGEISNLIETDFGFHIIRLTGTRGGERKPFEAARAEIEAEVRRTLAQRRWAETAEQFTNTAYEQSESLQPVVDKLGLRLEKAVVQRQPAPGASGPLASQKLLEAVFSGDSIRNRRNTDAVEFGTNQLVSARILKHEPERTLPLAEVREQVRERVIARKSAALAREEGAKRLAELRAQPATTLPIDLVISRVQPQGLPREVVDAVMRADATKLPAVAEADLGERGFFVLRVTQVLSRERPPAGDLPLRGQLAQAFAAAETEAYLGALKKRFKAEVVPSAVAAAASAPR